MLLVSTCIQKFDLAAATFSRGRECKPLNLSEVSEEITYSAGVPNTTTFPGKSDFSIIAFVAMAPASDATAMRLCPQA